jgi:hypothetical protein
VVANDHRSVLAARRLAFHRDPVVPKAKEKGPNKGREAVRDDGSTPSRQRLLLHGVALHLDARCRDNSNRPGRKNDHHRTDQTDGEESDRPDSVEDPVRGRDVVPVCLGAGEFRVLPRLVSALRPYHVRSVDERIDQQRARVFKSRHLPREPPRLWLRLGGSLHPVVAVLDPLAELCPYVRSAKSLNSDDANGKLLGQGQREHRAGDALDELKHCAVH